MNDHGEGNPCCYFHPREVLVGICALCLRERLLVLASKQGNRHEKKTTRQGSFKALAVKSTSIVMPKVFALSAFLHRSESWRHRRQPGDSDDDSIPSLEDSFISIKFEDDGQAAWDKKSVTRYLPTDGNGGDKSIVEHRGSVRWKKKVGHLFQLLRWKRSNKSNSCHVVAEASVEGRKGWMRSLTRRRTTIATDV